MLCADWCHKPGTAARMQPQSTALYGEIILEQIARLDIELTLLEDLEDC